MSEKEKSKYLNMVNTLRMMYLKLFELSTPRTDNIVY
jgi:dynactin complex subunit